MADSEGREQLEKRAESAEPDPIADRSMSGPLLLFSLLLIGTLLWSLYDEIFGQRPWRDYQRRFAELYSAYLEEIQPGQKTAEERVKELAEYQQLANALTDAEEEAKARIREIQSRTNQIDRKIADIKERFQDTRAKIAAKTYELETTESESGKARLRKAIDEIKKETVTVSMHDDSGNLATQRMNFDELSVLYNDLRDEKAKLTAEFIEKSRPANEARKQLEDFMQDHLIGLTGQQVEHTREGVKKFELKIRQINVANSAVIDRCESCHLGTREPIKINAAAMDDEAAFVSHPSRDLLKTHDPERFGCSLCHGGNGRGTTSTEKAHGRYKHWLWPLYYKENVQAGCNQCHNRDRVTFGADALNRGKDLFQNRGCTGCHRYEGFDRESEALAGSRQTVKQLEMDRRERLREIQEVTESAATARTDAEAQQLLARANALRQIISQIDARIDEFDTQSKYLMLDVKKVGPNLKEIKAKLKREWLPIWLRDPQAFRPGTKMPTFRLDDEEIKAVAAFIWQNALDAKLPQQPQGNAERGRDLFKTIGCLACHSIDGKLIGLGDEAIGGTFAANLSRLGEKANYEYIVRWVHNPRQRLAPYSPSVKRDLTAADYAKKGLPFVFDDAHSKSPLDGRELLVQNMTVMPNFRLSDQDARDIATFLTSLKRVASPYPEASFLDDPGLKEKGEKLVKAYGCASCHEIRGLEDEQRIGTELTPEGSKPIERLDFALLTEPAKKGVDPYTNEDIGRSWYNHKGFFENKLRNPGIYDRGKEKTPEERLRMPNIYLQDEEITALTTFLLGSVTASIPDPIRWNPSGGKKLVQDGWWVVQKYNCMGCHNVLIGQDSVMMGLPMYQSQDDREQLPPRLTSEGARVDPNWLLRFLKDPSLAGGQPRESARAAAVAHLTGNQTGGAANTSLGAQPGANRNGVRTYLRLRMPTFDFSPNELQALVNFFMGASSQQQPYIPERLDPLTEQEKNLARAIFTSPAAPCLKCHMTGDPVRDVRATAPNFLLARERLKPAWTRRWVVEPQLISPGTSMPSGLFNRDSVHGRWVINGINTPAFQAYDRDHVSLLVRYMFQITAEEQRRLVGAGGGGASVTGGATSTSAVRNSKWRWGGSRTTAVAAARAP
ncbi:MAG TPA: c-type cytochrome [Blastocatellia bacterium]|nr:c-type cytochrome [Blastocatellia bacterium]